MEILKDLVEREDGVEIVRSAPCVDHNHICFRIQPKYAAGKVVGRLRGRSKIIPRERH